MTTTTDLIRSFQLQSGGIGGGNFIDYSEVDILNLLNLAKDEIETDRRWSFLKTTIAKTPDSNLFITMDETDFNPHRVKSVYSRALFSNFREIGTEELSYRRVSNEFVYAVEKNPTETQGIYLAFGQQGNDSYEVTYYKKTPQLTKEQAPIFANEFWIAIVYKVLMKVDIVERQEPSRHTSVRWERMYKEVISNMKKFYG